MTNNKNLLKIAIITISLVQMGTNGIAPILAQIGAAFPESSDTQIQFLMTFPSIFCLIFTLVSAFLSDRMPKKTLTVTGLALIGCAGILACIFHGSLTILYVWAAFLGIGIGLVVPMAPSLVNENFKERELQTMLGWQNSANNVGSMLMTFLGGFLALMGWHYGYLVYLLCIPGIIFALIAVPGKKESAAVNSKKTERGKFRLVILKEMIITALFLFIYSAGPANLAMLVDQHQLGDTAYAGTISTLYLLGGTISGLLFGKIYTLLRGWTAPVGCLFLAAGSVITGLSSSTAMLVIGCLVAGASISMSLPVCMGGAAKLEGYETLNSALILSSSFVGVFLAPFVTNIAASVSGSTDTQYRFYTIAVIAVLISILSAAFFSFRKTRYFCD